MAGSRRQIGRSVSEEVARAVSKSCCRVVGVVEPARLKRQAAAADTRGQIVAQSFDEGDLLVESVMPGLGDVVPIVDSRRPFVRKLAEGGTNLVERQTDPLGNSNEGHPSQHVTVEDSLSAGRARGRNQALRLVVTQCRRRYSGPLGNFTDGEGFGGGTFDVDTS
jgi:hypothetical protein